MSAAGYKVKLHDNEDALNSSGSLEAYNNDHGYIIIVWDKGNIVCEGYDLTTGTNKYLGTDDQNPIFEKELEIVFQNIEMYLGEDFSKFAD